MTTCDLKQQVCKNKRPSTQFMLYKYHKIYKYFDLHDNVILFSLVFLIKSVLDQKLQSNFLPTTAAFPQSDTRGPCCIF